MKKFMALGLLLLSYVLSASDWMPVITNWSKSEYRAGAQNWGITEDERGWIYVANNKALLQFDGHSWTAYQLGLIRSVFMSSSGRIYYGGYNEFGFLETSDSGYAKQDLSDSAICNVGNFSDIWRIHEIDRVIYFVSYNHIFKLVDDVISVIRSDSRIFCTAVINGLLYAYAEGKGLCLLAGSRLIPVKGTEKLADSDVKGMFPYEDERIIIVTATDGIYKYHDGNLHHVRTAADERMCESQIYCADIYEDHLFVGTIMDGLHVINLKSLQTSRINVPTGLQNNTVHCVHATPNGNLWLGLGNGVSYINFNSPISILHSPIENLGMGYTSILHDSKFYLGTNQGLYVTGWPVNSSSNQCFMPVEGTKGQIWSLQEIDGRLLCGANKGALEIRDDRAEMLDNSDGFWNFQKIPDNDNMLLAGTYNGLVIFTRSGKSAKWRRGWAIEGFDKSCVHLVYDEDLNLWWVDCGMSVCRVAIDSAFRKVTEVTTYSSHSKPYISTDGKAALSSDGQRHVSQDRFGNWWYIHKGKLYRNYSVDGNEHTDSLIATLTDGYLMEHNEHVFTVDDSTAIIATSDGFRKYIFNKNPVVKFDDHFDFSIRNFTISSSSSSRQYHFNGQTKTEIVLPFDNEAVYRFETNTATSPYSKVIYRAQLIPFNSSPMPLNDQGVKEYSGLQEGKYTFLVTSDDLITGKSHEDSVSFRILPPWYRSVVARVVYAMLLLGAFVWLFLGIKVYYYRQTRRRLYAQRQEDRKALLALQNEKLAESVRLKSQEISSSMLNLIQKKELLSSLFNESKKISLLLDEAKTNPSRIIEVQNAVDRLSSQIKHNIQDDDSWKKLEINFDIVHQDFISRLKEAYPVLSYTDVKLAVYIRMNLLTKEIAPLLNISERGLESARYRLRKKLNLKNTERLSDFLFKF